MLANVLKLELGLGTGQGSAPLKPESTLSQINLKLMTQFTKKYIRYYKFNEKKIKIPNYDPKPLDKNMQSLLVCVCMDQNLIYQNGTKCTTYNNLKQNTISRRL